MTDPRGASDRGGGAVDSNLMTDLDTQFPFGFGYWNLICPRCVEACREWFTTHGYRQANVQRDLS